MPEQDIFQNGVEVEADLPQNVEVKQYTSSITIGDVTTLPAGSNATVENVGTEEQAILNFGLPKGDAGSMWGELAGDIEDQEDLNTILTGLRTDVDAKAPKASPAFTGTPTAPTAVDDTNTTQIATTAFVKNAITNLQNALQSYINSVGFMKNINTSAGVKFWTAGTEQVTSSTSPVKTYTVPSNGWLLLQYVSNSSYTTALYIGGTNMLSETKDGISIPVSSGTVITQNGIIQLSANRYLLYTSINATFFPEVS